MHEYYFIVNSKSNSGRAGDYIREHEAEIKSRLKDVAFKYVDDPGVLIKESEKASREAKVVVACGGDGTMQSIARGISGSDVIMGIIPIGTGNDFAKSVGLKLKEPIGYYLDILSKKRAKEVDIPKLNDDVFVNTVGIGFDGLTNYYSSKYKKLRGMLKYTLAGLKAFLVAKPYRASIGIDGNLKELSVWLVALANGAVEGGKYLISPGSKNNDGQLEMVIVPAYSRIKLLIAFLWLSIGKSLGPSFSTVITFKEAEIRFQESHYIHLDGEVGTPSLTYKVSVNDEKQKVVADL